MHPIRKFKYRFSLPCDFSRRVEGWALQSQARERLQNMKNSLSRFYLHVAPTVIFLTPLVSAANVYRCPSTFEINPPSQSGWNLVQKSISLPFSRVDINGTPGRQQTLSCLYKNLSSSIELYQRQTQGATGCPVGIRTDYGTSLEAPSSQYVPGMTTWKHFFRVVRGADGLSLNQKSNSCAYDLGGSSRELVGFASIGEFRNCSLSRGSTDAGGCSH